MDFTGLYFDKASNAIYYVRHFKIQSKGTEKEVLGWFGETMAEPRTRIMLASVFFGEISGTNSFKGTEWDVPKGIRNRSRPLTVIGSSINRNRRLTLRTGGLDQTLIELKNRPDSMPSFLEHGAGFYDAHKLLSLTGVWKSWSNKGDAVHEDSQQNKYSMYYVRQENEQVIAFGEHGNSYSKASWSSVYIGTTVADGTNRGVRGFWFDVPKSVRTLLNGEWKAQSGPAQVPFRGDLEPLQEVEIKSMETPADPDRPGKNAVWVKTDSVRVNFNYRSLEIAESADDGSIFSPSGGDEPYVIPFFFAITGETLNAYRILATDAGTAGVVFDSPLENPTLQSDNWPKNNLTWQEDLRSGTSLTIPDFIGYHESVIRPIWGLQPSAEPARESARYVVGLVVLEEQHSGNDSVRDAYRRFRDNAKQQLNDLLTNVTYGFNSVADVEGWLHRIADDNHTPPVGRTVESIIDTTLLQENGRDNDGTPIFRGFNEGGTVYPPAALPDRVLGVYVRTFTFEELRRMALGGQIIRLPISFNTHGSFYRIAAEMYVNLSADVPVQTARELELSLFTQEEDKREGDRGSVVRVQVRNSTRDLLPAPWVIGSRYEKFEKWSFKNGRLPLSPLLSVSQLRRLQILFEQGPAGSVFWEMADEWKLNGVRLLVFDAFGKRRLLLNNYPGYLYHFRRSETVSFTLS